MTFDVCVYKNLSRSAVSPLNAFTWPSPHRHYILRMSSPAEQLALVLPSPQTPPVVRHVPTPVPAHGDLLVRIHSTGLNPADWKIAKLGIFLTPKDYPARLGFEAAGEVIDVGEGVQGWKKGDRAVYQGTMGAAHSTFQQYSTVPFDIAAKIPSNVTDDEAATVPTAYAAATIGLYHPRAGAGRVPPWAPKGAGAYADTPLLVLGGAGNVGQMAIQLGKLSGFSPIITTASPKNASYLLSLGATHVIPRDDPLTAVSLASITSTPISLVYDAVGAQQTQQTGYDLLADGGDLVAVMADSVKKDDDARKRRVISFYGSPWPEPNRPFGREAYEALTGYLEQGLIKPNRVEVIGGLAAIPDGLQRLQQGQVGGFKLVAHPQESA